MKSNQPEIWRKKVLEKIKENGSPKKADILFLGDSNIEFWKNLETLWPEKKIVNLGISGSKPHVLTYYKNQLIEPWQPDCIVVGSGENVLNEVFPGTVRQVFEEVKTLFETIHREKPCLPLIYLAMKPSFLRHRKWKKMKKANKMIHDWIQKQEHSYYMDFSEVLFKKEKSLRLDIWTPDLLHLNSRGYRLWEPLLKNKVSEIMHYYAE